MRSRVTTHNPPDCALAIPGSFSVPVSRPVLRRSEVPGQGGTRCLVSGVAASIRSATFAQLVVRFPGSLTNADHLPLPPDDGSDGSLHSGSGPRSTSTGQT